MSAHEDAKRAAVNHVMRFQTNYVDQNAVMAVDAFLAALPPSIVVDGKVVALEKVAEAYMVDLWSDHATEWADHVADLARQVSA